jgi:hypothetical protein
LEFNTNTSNTIEDFVLLGMKYFTGRQEEKYKISFASDNPLRMGTLR